MTEPIMTVPVGGTIGWLGHLASPPVAIPANFKPNNGYDFTSELRSKISANRTDTFNTEGDYFYCGSDNTIGKVASKANFSISLKNMPEASIPSDSIEFTFPSYEVPTSQLSKLQSFMTENQVVYRIDDDEDWVQSGSVGTDASWIVFASSANQPSSDSAHGHYLIPATDTASDWNNGDGADWMSNTNADRSFYGHSADWTEQRLDNDSHSHEDQAIYHSHSFSSVKVSMSYDLKATVTATNGSWTRGGSIKTNVVYTPTPNKYAKMMMITRIW